MRRFYCLLVFIYMLVLISLTQKQDEKSFKIFKSRERELMNKYKYVISLWRRVSTHTLLYFTFLWFIKYKYVK